MDATLSSETSVLTRSTRRHIQEDSLLHIRIANASFTKIFSGTLCQIRGPLAAGCSQLLQQTVPASENTQERAEITEPSSVKLPGDTDGRLGPPAL
jgi:hypothetical protein